MSNKRGFTLVEILVVLAISTLAFVLIGGFLVYLTESSGMLIHESEELMTAQSIEDYLRGYIDLEVEDDQSNKNQVFESLKTKFDPTTNSNTEGIIRMNSDGSLLKSGQAIFKNTGLTFFNVYESSDGFLKCEMHFENGAKFTFILGVYKNGG